MPPGAETWPEHVQLRPDGLKPRMPLRKYECLKKDGAEELALSGQYAESQRIGHLFDRLHQAVRDRDHLAGRTLPTIAEPLPPQELTHELPHDPVEYLTDLIAEHQLTDLTRPMSEDDLKKRAYRPKKPFRVTPHTVAKYGDLNNTPAGHTHLRGLCLDTEGKPIAGANVTVAKDKDRVPQRTAENGSFALEALPLNKEVTVVVQKPGYPPTMKTLCPVMGQVVTLTMTPIAVRAKVSAAKGGTVKDPKGRGQVTIPPNSLVTPNGKKYTGEAEVAVAIVDTSGDAGRDAVSGLAGVGGKDNGIGGKNPRKTLAALWMGITAVDPEGEFNNAELDFDKEASCTVQLKSHNNPLGGLASSTHPRNQPATLIWDSGGHMLPSVHHKSEDSGLWVPKDLPGVDGSAVPPSHEKEPEDPFSMDPRYLCEWRFLGEYQIAPSGVKEYADRYSFAVKQGATMPRDPIGWTAECVKYVPPPPPEPPAEDGEEYGECEGEAPTQADRDDSAVGAGHGASGGEADSLEDGYEPEPSGAPTKYQTPRLGWTQTLGEPGTVLSENFDAAVSQTGPVHGPNEQYSHDQGGVLGYSWRGASRGVFLDPFGDKAQLGRGVFFRPEVPPQPKTALKSSEEMTEIETKRLIREGCAKPPSHRELRGLHWGDERPHLVDLARCEKENQVLQAARWKDGVVPKDEEPEAWGATMAEYFAPEIEKEVVAKLRATLPEAVCSRKDVQRVLFVADYDVAKAADLLITDPTVVMRWKAITVVLRIKEALKWAQPYVHEYKAAFEASGGEIEETVEILLKDQIILRRNCEAEVRYRMQRARYKGECFGHYTLCLPTERELKKALDAVSPDTDAVVERLNFMPSIQERETQAQRGVLRDVFKDALHDVVTSNKQWEKATTDPDEVKRRPIQHSLEDVVKADYDRALEKSGALPMIGDHTMVDKFNTVRREICAKIETACLEKASHAFCTDPVVVQREMVANCTGRNLIFQFRWTTPAAEDLQTVYTKCMPGNVLDLRDLTAKHKLATTMAMALWKLPHLVKDEVLGETRPRFEFTTPTEEELSIMYKQVVGTRVVGRNEISTTAAAIDKALMKLPHIGPPETRGRLLKAKFSQVREKLREDGVIDYSLGPFQNNPTWEEFKEAFEGPGADNVDRTTAVVRELPTVLQRESAAKEAAFWGWLKDATCQEIKNAPHYVLHFDPRDHVERIFRGVKADSGVMTLEACMKGMPPSADLPCLPRQPMDIPSEAFKAMVAPFVAIVAEDDEVANGENNARVEEFWKAFRDLSETWTRKTGKRYYVEEQPNRREILEVMKHAVEEGQHAEPSFIVGEYYKLRRSNFVAHFATLVAEKDTPDGRYTYEMSANTTGWWDVSMSYQAVLCCGITCVDGKMLGEATWDDTETRERGFSGLMVESIGISYTGTAQVPTMADGSFQVMAQHSSTIHIKVLSEFAEEVFGPYQTDASGAIMTLGRFNLVMPAKAWPTVLEPPRGEAV